MPNIVNSLRWYGSNITKSPAQTVPTVEQLIAAGADETGYKLEEYEGYNPETDALPEGRDTRTWNICSKEYDTYLMYIPDAEGFYLENYNGNKWRPEDLDECIALVDEIGFQEDRYGDLD